MPLVRVSLALQHNSTLGQKKKGYERFTFCQHCKKTGHAHVIEPISSQKGWVAPQRHLRKTQGNGRATGSYKMTPFLGFRVEACKQNSYSEKDRNQTCGQKKSSIETVGVLRRAG